MVTVDADIQLRLTYGTKYYSLGGSNVSNVLISVEQESEFRERNLHNLFRRIPSWDIEAGNATYRCLAIYNADADTWENVKAWLISSGEVQDEVTMSMGTIALVGGKTVQIASEYEVPAGVTFTSPVTKATGIDLGNIATTVWMPLWIKRLPTTDAKSRSMETVVIRVEGDDANGSTSYAGKTFRLSWDTITSEVEIVFKRLNDVPIDRINLEGVQESYDDVMYLVNQLVGAGATDAQINRVCQARAMYHAYQQWTVELERAGGGLPPMVASRVYELRRIANEMMNSISKTGQRMKIQGIKGRSWKGRSY